MSSKLAQIRKVLKNNPSVIIFAVQENNNLLKTDPRRFHYGVHFYVAPKIPLYTVDELQAFMLSLVPEITASYTDNFSELSEDFLEFGSLQFNENNGTETVRREFTFVDESIVSDSRFVGGKIVVEETNEVWWCTFVNVFPNIEIASEVLSGQFSGGILHTELLKYQNAP